MQSTLIKIPLAHQKIKKEYLDFNLLLDLAHLKVSANTLGLELEIELENMIKII